MPQHKMRALGALVLALNFGVLHALAIDRRQALAIGASALASLPRRLLDCLSPRHLARITEADRLIRELRTRGLQEVLAMRQPPASPLSRSP